MTTCLATIAFLIVALSTSAASHARDGRVFPPELPLEEGGETHRLTFTGESERVFLLFNIYAIAHYAEVDGRPPLSLDNVVADGRGKAIVIRFDRKLGLERIRDEFADSIRRNGQPEWLAEAEPTIAAFMRAIDRDARAGDQLVFYWLAGGRLFAEFNGERAFAATDTAFAKLIWSIWFGDDPVCDRAEMLAQVTPEGSR
ncbi:MAG: chalcone isomerase family protein [Chromatocurvus sp.]